MKKILFFLLALLMVLSMAACDFTAAPVETEPPTEAPTELPTEDPGPTFEDTRVLTYYFKETIPYQYYTRYGEMEIIENNNVHLKVYDQPCYNGDAVRQLAPGDLILLGNREITVESIRTEDTYQGVTYVINDSQTKDSLWLYPFSFYNVETKQMEMDYIPRNWLYWGHYVMVEEYDLKLAGRMTFHNFMTQEEDMSPEAFLADWNANSDSYCLHNTMLDMVDGSLEGIYILTGIDGQTDTTMMTDGLQPIDPERLQFLLTGE